MQVRTAYGLTRVEKLRYKNGRLAIQLTDVENGAPIAVLTINLPEFPLADGEFFVKTWSENISIARACLASGHFKDTGKRVSTGFADAEVWRFA